MAFLLYTIDPKHSQLHLEMDHLGGISVLTARCVAFSGSLSWDGASNSAAVDARIETTTISSSLVTLDPLLTGSEMFDVAAFPYLTLKIHPSIGVSSGPSLAAGRLEIRGIERDCEVVLLSTRAGVNRRGNNVVGVRASLVVRQSDFGMDALHHPTLSNEIRMLFNVEATDAPPLPK